MEHPDPSYDGYVASNFLTRSIHHLLEVVARCVPVCYGLEGVDGGHGGLASVGTWGGCQFTVLPCAIACTGQSLDEMHFSFRSPHLFDTYHS